MDLFNVFKVTKFPQSDYSNFGRRAAATQDKYGGPAMAEGLRNLMELLQGRGRVDPRLLAKAQADNARMTQSQVDMTRGRAARGGANSGLMEAMQAAIGASGRNTAANLNYQDIADSYGRNQQNLSLLDQMVIQPSLGFGALGNQYGLGQQANLNAQKQGVLGLVGSMWNSAGKAAGA